MTDPKREFQQAMQLLSGSADASWNDRMLQAQNLMHKSAESFPPARAKLSVIHLMEMAENYSDDAAVSLFLQSAMDGFPPSIRELAVLLLGNRETEAMGAGLLRRAVHSGDWIAAFLILRQAQRGIYLASKSELTILAQQLSAAVPFRSQLINYVEGLPGDITPLKPAPFYKAVSVKVIAEALESSAPSREHVMHQSPLVASKTAVLTALECDYLMAISSALMQPSQVVDADDGGAKRAGYRTSDGAVLTPAYTDFPAALITRKLAYAANIRPEQGEFLSLLRYTPGQEYRPHHDYLDEDINDYSKVKLSGQRSHTLLTYLNEHYVGGETEFPDLRIKYKGGVGDSLLFENIDKEGIIMPKSLHAGLPVIQGEKWLATLWCRERVFWPWRLGIDSVQGSEIQES